MERSTVIVAIIFSVGCSGVVDPVGSGSDEPLYPASEEATSPEVQALFDLGDGASGLECADGGVYWYDGATRSVVRFKDGSVRRVLTVDSVDAVVLRGAGDSVVVGALGASGAVWVLGPDDGAEEVHSGRVDAVAGYAEAAWWYDGQEIRGSGGTGTFAAADLVDLAANASGPAWFDGSGTLRLVRNGEVAEAHRNFVGFYPGTLRGVADVVTWGSKNGAKVLPEDTGVIISRERDVNNIGAGEGTITFCEHVFGAVKNIFAMPPRGEAESVADHETCVETVRCGDYVYWTTEKHSLLRAPLSGDGN
ncbi:hypothetical protein WMF38_57385 [Sorangium sp. So ce118]